MSPPTAMALSSSIGCLLVFTMWGFGGTVGLPVFAPFAVLFGVATGGFTAMWSQSAHAIAGPDREQQTMLFSGKYKLDSSPSRLQLTSKFRLFHRTRTWRCSWSDCRCRTVPISHHGERESMGFGGIPRIGLPRRGQSGQQRRRGIALRTRGVRLQANYGTGQACEGGSKAGRVRAARARDLGRVADHGMCSVGHATYRDINFDQSQCNDYRSRRRSRTPSAGTG